MARPKTGLDRLVGDELFRRLCGTRALMDDAYEEPWDLRSLAREAGTSPFHYLRTFRQAFGKTPHDYLTGVRLARARAALVRGRSVTEVCFDVGFSSLGSFSTLFRRRLGVSPVVYQREVRRLAQVPLAYALMSIPFCFASRFAPPVPDRIAILEKRPLVRP
jgi:AraC-like DNA-binding protein